MATAPFASSEAIRRRMKQQARRDTTPEVLLRRRLHRLGLRYFVHRRPLPYLRREADILFPNLMIAVFVDGCFWHGCPAHGQRRHEVNGWYWPEKIERNRRRDADTDSRLIEAGWLPVRVWECEDADSAASRVADAVRGRRQRTGRLIR